MTRIKQQDSRPSVTEGDWLQDLHPQIQRTNVDKNWELVLNIVLAAILETTNIFIFLQFWKSDLPL